MFVLLVEERHSCLLHSLHDSKKLQFASIRSFLLVPIKVRNFTTIQTVINPYAASIWTNSVMCDWRNSKITYTTWKLPKQWLYSLSLFNVVIFLIMDQGLILFVVVYELHLVEHFGITFREEFGELKNCLFQVILDTLPMLFLTDTCINQIQTSPKALLGINLNAVHRQRKCFRGR